MANERITEDMVEERLRSLGYYDDPDVACSLRCCRTLAPIVKVLLGDEKRKEVRYDRTHRDSALVL